MYNGSSLNGVMCQKLFSIIREKAMKKRVVLLISGLSVLMLVTVGIARDALAQATKQQLVGTWTLVSESRASETFGGNAQGMVMFDAAGNFSLQIMGDARRKFAGSSRSQGTPEENKGAIQGALAYYGTYSVDETSHTLTFRVTRANFANWDGTEQKRTVLSVTGDELKWVNPSPSVGGTPTSLVWKRAK
jgi:hypothetical protein